MDLMTQEEAAIFLEVTVGTVENYRRRRSLQTVLDEGRVKVTRASVEKLKEALAVRAGGIYDEPSETT
jgi:hypothetical protein